MSDRTKPPPGYLLHTRGWHQEHRPRWYAEVDTAEGHKSDVVYDCWEHRDALVAEGERKERARIGAGLDRLVRDQLILDEESGDVRDVWICGDVEHIVCDSTDYMRSFEREAEDRGRREALEWALAELDKCWSQGDPAAAIRARLARLAQLQSGPAWSTGYDTPEEREAEEMAERTLQRPSGPGRKLSGPEHRPADVTEAVHRAQAILSAIEEGVPDGGDDYSLCSNKGMADAYRLADMRLKQQSGPDGGDHG